MSRVICSRYFKPLPKELAAISNRALLAAIQKWCDLPINRKELEKALRGEMYETHGENFSADDLLLQIELWFRTGIPDAFASTCSMTLSEWTKFIEEEK